MRITPIICNTKNNIMRNCRVSEKDFTKNSRSLQNRSYYTVPYFVSFGSYDNDKIFLERGSEILTNTMRNVSRYYNQGNPDMVEALGILQRQAPLYYEKLNEEKAFFKQIEKGFNKYNATTIKALYDIRSGDKMLSSYWLNKSLIGENKTINIINKNLLSDGENVNSKIKNISLENFEEIKNELILAWFKDCIDNKKYNQINLIKNENKKYYDELKSVLGTEQAKMYAQSIKTSYYDDFKKGTIDKILNPSSGNEEKLEGFSSLVNYIEMVLCNESAENLENDLNIIASVQKNFNSHLRYESLPQARNDILKLYQIAIDYWKENDLPVLMNDWLKKEIYINKAEKQNPKIYNFQNYNGLNTNEKYFVSKYYEFKNNDYENNDLLKTIIDDRNIDNPAKIIDMMSLKIDSQRNKYFESLDNFYEILQMRKNGVDVDIPERYMNNPKDAFSFLNMYLFVLGKLEDFQDKTNEAKLNYLTKLTKDELQLASKEIKRYWDDEELKYAIDAETRKQAYLTSINKKMYDELIKVNLNLDNIKIQMNDVSFSLKDLLENRYIINDENNFRKVMQQSSLLIANSENQYNHLSESEKRLVDKKIKETLPPLIDNLVANTNDRKIIEELNLLKSKCKNSDNAGKNSFGLIKSIILGRTMSYGINSGNDAIHKLMSSGHRLPGLAVNDLADNLSDLSDTFDTASQHIKGAGGLLTMLAPVDPVSAGIVLGLSTVVGCCVGASNAKNLEKGQRDLYVPFSY